VKSELRIDKRGLRKKIRDERVRMLKCWDAEMLGYSELEKRVDIKK
jgi:hypothetical protein